MIRAGFPAITTLSPKLLVTTEPAPTTTLLPNVTPGKTVTRPPNQQLSSIVMGAHFNAGVPLDGIQGMDRRVKPDIGTKVTVLANCDGARV